MVVPTSVLADTKGRPLGTSTQKPIEVQSAEHHEKANKKQYYKSLNKLGLNN